MKRHIGANGIHNLNVKQLNIYSNNYSTAIIDPILPTTTIINKYGFLI